ncbi:hypothetical protein ACFLRM_07150 [Acidobacteriota bacterium]
MNYMGIDHHYQYSHIIIIDEAGEVIRPEKVANLPHLTFKFFTINLDLKKQEGGKNEKKNGNSAGSATVLGLRCGGVTFGLDPGYKDE